MRTMEQFILTQKTKYILMKEFYDAFVEGTPFGTPTWKQIGKLLAAEWNETSAVFEFSWPMEIQDIQKVIKIENILQIVYDAMKLESALKRNFKIFTDDIQHLEFFNGEKGVFWRRETDDSFRILIHPKKHQNVPQTILVTSEDFVEEKLDITNNWMFVSEKDGHGYLIDMRSRFYHKTDVLVVLGEEHLSFEFQQDKKVEKDWKNTFDGCWLCLLDTKEDDIKIEVIDAMIFMETQKSYIQLRKHHDEISFEYINQTWKMDCQNERYICWKTKNENTLIWEKIAFISPPDQYWV